MRTFLDFAGVLRRGSSPRLEALRKLFAPNFAAEVLAYLSRKGLHESRWIAKP